MVTVLRIKTPTVTNSNIDVHIQENKFESGKKLRKFHVGRLQNSHINDLKHIELLNSCHVLIRPSHKRNP